jgi:hypothetical protein
LLGHVGPGIEGGRSAFNGGPNHFCTILSVHLDPGSGQFLGLAFGRADRQLLAMESMTTAAAASR